MHISNNNSKLLQRMTNDDNISLEGTTKKSLKKRLMKKSALKRVRVSMGKAWGVLWGMVCMDALMH